MCCKDITAKNFGRNCKAVKEDGNQRIPGKEILKKCGQ